jgi:hypothetical protein
MFLHEGRELYLNSRYPSVFIDLKTSSHEMLDFWTEIGSKIFFSELHEHFLSEGMLVLDMAEGSAAM